MPRDGRMFQTADLVKPHRVSKSISCEFARHRLAKARCLGGNFPTGMQKDMSTGTVKFFNTTRGFGFIQPDDGTKDIFVHISAVQNAGMDHLAEGQKLSFEVQQDPRGPKAVNLKAA